MSQELIEEARLNLVHCAANIPAVDADPFWRVAMALLEKISPLSHLMADIAAEVATAEAKWPPMNSAHEAYAVLLEEVDELWDHVKTNQTKRDLPAMRKEAAQVAAMAVRFIRDVVDGDRGRK